MHAAAAFAGTVVLGTTLLAATTGWAGTSCPGGCPTLPANSRSESLNAIPLPAGTGPLVTATLKKGKPKRILQAEAMMTTGIAAPGAPISLALMVDVNGILLEPTIPGPVAVAMTDCGGSLILPGPFSCTVTGTWWLDLDQNPALIGVPLAVTLNGGNLFLGPAVPVDVTLTVRLQKK
jgi:hypothetical protein